MMAPVPVDAGTSCFDEGRAQLKGTVLDMPIYACAALCYAMVEFWYGMTCSAGMLAVLFIAFICDMAVYAWCNTPSAPNLHSPVDRFHGPFADNYSNEHYEGYYGSVNCDD